MSAINNQAVALAEWIVAREPGITHLKVQKLCFYAYGYLTALAQFPEIPFEAWQHGPVSRVVWKELKRFASSGLQCKTPKAPNWNSQQLRVLEDVLAVYGSLSAWQLREQSHTEAPWKNNYQTTLVIPDAEIREHFRKKVTHGAVELPEAVTSGWSLKIDGLSTPRFKTFWEAADVCRGSRA